MDQDCPSYGQVFRTRLMYNCAHLRLNNKKNTNKMSQNGPRDFLGEIFLGENSLDENIWGENFLGEIFLGVKFFG